ncbi:MAG: hypothetical protein H6767_05085 [Candidatus Peribacteria bacterium]|nr:MAG: hypothetical protein H6767_05085 [Candidatus Peribacteria bacterium]
MNQQIKENIILPAWNTIKNDIKIKKYYFIPGLFSIIILTALLVYQTIYTYVVIFGNKDKALQIILDLFHSQFALEIIIGSIIFVLVYMVITPMFEGGLIKYLDQKNKCQSEDEYVSFGNAIGLGMTRFLPLFEYNNIFSEFKLISILNAYLFTIRFVGAEYISYVSYLFLVVFFFSVILNVLFAYSKYEIMLKNKNAFQAAGASAKLAIVTLFTTTRLYLLMFFLNFRVILNFIIFLSFPLVMVMALGFITTKIYLFVAIGILSILFIIFILILGYVTTVLEIFKTAIWYYAYKEALKKAEEDE